MLERELVREPVGRAAEDRRVAEGVQRGAPAQRPGLSNASSVRAATRSGARLRPTLRGYAGRRRPLTGWPCRMIHPADPGGRSQYTIGSPRTQFVHVDHLGSTRLITTMTPSVLDSLDFLPFGEQIT